MKWSKIVIFLSHLWQRPEEGGIRDALVQGGACRCRGGRGGSGCHWRGQSDITRRQKGELNHDLLFYLKIFPLFNVILQSLQSQVLSSNLELVRWSSGRGPNRIAADILQRKLRRIIFCEIAYQSPHLSFVYGQKEPKNHPNYQKLTNVA